MYLCLMIHISQIMYEDNHILVVNKPTGIPTQDDESGDTSLFDKVKNYIRITYDKPGEVYLGLVHRLDRPVSGIVLFAKTSKAAARLSEMIKNRNIEKTYLAIVENKPSQMRGEIKCFIWKDNATNKSYCSEKPKKGGKEALLHYKVLSNINKDWLLEVKPVTGRSHQIRSQLSWIGCPIIGDSKYGSKIPLNDRSICLQAHKLSFIHPVKKEPIEIQALDPKNKFWDKFDLRNLKGADFE